MFDTAARKVLRTIEGTEKASSNGATLLPEFDLGLSNNEDGTLTPFSLSTLEARPVVKLGEGLDTSHDDPVTKRVLVNMAAGKDGTDLAVLEAPSFKPVGTVHVRAKKPEHADADGKGNLFMATRDTETVLRIDMRTLRHRRMAHPGPRPDQQPRRGPGQRPPPARLPRQRHDAGRKINTAVGPFYANAFFPSTFAVVVIGR